MLKPKVFIGSGLLLLAIAGVALGFFFESGDPLVLFQPTARGHFFEKLLPQDALFAGSFNPHSEVQREEIHRLWETIFQENKDAVIPFLLTKLAGRNGVALTIEELAPLFVQEPAMAFSIEKDSEGKLQLVLLFSPQEITPIVQEAIGAINESATMLRAGVLEDIVFITSSEESATGVTHRFYQTGTSLIDNAAFRDNALHLQRAQRAVGYLFVQADTSLIASSLLMLYPQEGALRAEQVSILNPGSAQDPLVTHIVSPYVPHLYKKVPADNAIFFMESHALGPIISKQLGSFGAFAELDKDNFLKKFNEEIVPFSNQGVAFTVQDTGRSLPTISLYVDASNSSQKAGQIVAELDTFADGWIELLEAAFGEAAEIERQKLQGLGSSIIVRPREITGETPTPKIFELMREGIAISYGLTADGLLFFSASPDLALQRKVQKTIGETELFSRTQELPIKPGTFIIFDTRRLRSYLDALVEGARAVQAFSLENERAYALLTKYLRPLQGVVSVTDADAGVIESIHTLLLDPDASRE